MAHRFGITLAQLGRGAQRRRSSSTHSLAATKASARNLADDDAGIVPTSDRSALTSRAQ